MKPFGEPFYGLTRRLVGCDLAAASARVRTALSGEGFGILTEIDVQATLKKKLDVAVEPYLILGACNPGLAHRALSIEPAVGLALPCNVVLRQEGADTVVSIADPGAMLRVVSSAEIQPIVDEARARLSRALTAV